MTLEKLYKEFAQSPIKVMSGYNGKVLAKRYDPKKHEHISNREIFSIFSEIEIPKSHGYNQIAYPILCVYVNGHEEWKLANGVSEN